MDVKNKILNCINKNPCVYRSIIKRDFKNVFSEIENSAGKTFSQKCYGYVYGIDSKNCIVCGSPTKFISFQSGYSKTCSKKCSSKLGIETFKKNNDGKNPSQVDSIKEKKKNTLRRKYNVDSPFQLKTSVDNRNSIFYKRFNGPPFRNQEVREKCRNSKRRSFVNSCLVGDRTPEIIPAFNFDTFTSVTDRSLQFKCSKCGNTFTHHLMWGTSPVCKLCNPASKFQNEVQKFLLEHGINIECNKFDVIKNRELDIVIPSHNIAIECNGLYWHSEISGKKLPYYHIQKTKLCHDCGIKLIHIFEDEWKYKTQIVKNRILNILKKSDMKINARDCLIREISPKEKREFLEANHLQGDDSSAVKLGLFYNNALVSAMTFGKSRFKNTELEMHRFCSSGNVRGAASKLFNYFLSKYNPSKVISYCDIRYSGLVGGFYDKLGFVMESQTKCNYWYVVGDKRCHRLSFQKHKLKNKLRLFNSKLTEWENMKNHGYDRIWDCGNLRYVWNK